MLCGTCGKKKDVRGYKANEMKCGLLFICLLLPLPSWRFLLIIIYTVLSLISLTYCGEPVVRTLAAPDTSRVTKLFFCFILRETPSPLIINY